MLVVNLLPDFGTMEVKGCVRAALHYVNRPLVTKQMPGRSGVKTANPLPTLKI